MSRIRSIHPGLSSDEAYMTMSMPAKAAWPLLWTECDDHGVFEWKPIVLKARIFPAETIAFGPILDEFAALGCVMRFDVGGKPYGVVHNFCRWQRPKNPSYRLPFPAEIRRFAGWQEDDRGSAPPGLPLDYPPPAPDAAKPRQPQAKASAWPPEEIAHWFNEVFRIHPKKAAKARCRDLFAAQVAEGNDPLMIAEAAAFYASSTTDTEPRYLIPLDRWIEEARFLDRSLWRFPFNREIALAQRGYAEGFHL